MFFLSDSTCILKIKDEVFSDADLPIFMIKVSKYIFNLVQNLKGSRLEFTESIYSLN